MNASRFWISVAVMSATIMQVLDTTIIIVALPHMTGELGANADSISWVLTSYLVASTVLMPLTGFFTDRLGRKKYLLISIAGFVVTSALCGLANGLPEMVFFRLAQGVFGASLVPLSQAIMVESFPPLERGKAMSIWAMGVMIAPVLGPTLGGYLTEMLSWRWTFYINLPIGIASFMLAARYVPDTPVKARSMDWLGFSALALSIGCAQLVLDRGAEKDWFDSSLIRNTTALAVLSFLAFVGRSMRGKHPLFDLTVLKDRNFAVASFITLVNGFGIFGSMLLLPLILENMLGFPAMEAGTYLMPRGIATFFCMLWVGEYANRFSLRKMVFWGICMNIAGAYLLTHLSPQAPGSIIFFPIVLQGLGMGLIFVPLSSVAFASIPPHLAAEAAGLYSLMRSIGSTVGLSAAATLLNYHTRVHWDEMRASITPYSVQAQQFLAPLGLTLDNAGTAVMAQLVQQQAQVQGFVDTYWIIALSFVGMLPLLLLITPQPKNTGPAPLLAHE